MFLFSNFCDRILTKKGGILIKAIGIIAEYNPFHNGHLYHLQKIKEKYKNHVIILVLSTNFTQRGEASIISKDKKVKIALTAGIDLIVELPFPFATQSADYFSYGAITILEHLNCERIIFGSETDNVNDLEEIAKAEINNPDFDKLVKIYSKFGNNYPTSLSLALKDLTNKEINTPNDLLGISYIKTILKNNYKITYETIKRTNNYHSLELNNNSSATAIRKALYEKKEIKEEVPSYTLNYLQDLHFIEEYFPFLKYKILTEDNLLKYQTVDTGLEKKLKKEILKSNTYQELVNNLKEKRITENKIKRMLLHILCNFTKDKANSLKEVKYIRILGFNNKGKNYLNYIKKDINIPIISKIKRDKDEMLELELKIQAIYDILSKEKLEEKIFPIKWEDL